MSLPLVNLRFTSGGPDTLSYHRCSSMWGVEGLVYLYESWCTSPAATQGCPAPSGPWSLRWRLQCSAWVSCHSCALYNSPQTYIILPTWQHHLLSIFAVQYDNDKILSWESSWLSWLTSLQQSCADQTPQVWARPILLLRRKSLGCFHRKLYCLKKISPQLFF